MRIRVATSSAAATAAERLKSAIIAGFLMEPGRGDVTVLLERLSEGDRSVEDELMPRVYMELHTIAISRLRHERSGHTLQATELVHEAYMRLRETGGIAWQNRLHFFRVAARIMRRILVDYARKKKSEKNNPGAPLLRLEDALAFSEDSFEQTLEIDQLMESLATACPRQADVFEMKFFGGLSEEEIAATLGVSIRTIRRDWLMARAWLHSQMNAS